MYAAGWYILIFVFSALVLLPVAVTWVTKWIKWWKYLRYLRSLPSPPRHWLMGHVSQMDMGEANVNRLTRYHIEFPDLYVSFFGPFLPNVVITSPEHRKTILKSTEPKADFYYFLVDWIGDGLLLSSGEKWFQHRKMLTPGFHFDILKSYVPIVNEVTHTLLDIWQEHSDKGTSFNVVDYASLYTLDILLRCAFSDHSSSCLVEKDNSPYVNAVHEISKIPVLRMRFPPYHPNWIFKLSPLGRKFHGCIKILHEYCDKAINKRRKQLLEDSGSLSKKYVDFLDILLSAKDEQGYGLTDEEIREEVNTFMFEGHDTTAAGLYWILYCLATNPDHQEKCRSEARQVMHNKDDVSWEDLNKLTYISMCIKESMRLYPPVPMIARKLSQDCELDGYKLQKGTNITIHVNAHHHNPKIWPDPEKFNPLRFSIENVKLQDSFAFTPFSAGPRNCIGQNFAMHELKIAVAHIVNRFYIGVDPSHKVERFLSLILRAKFPV
ncbi:cytochrome P450 4B1-like isoform X2 [Dysidea avara]|uniref:cytochrome P450 4B1-like isoform X2 n=1 Tax=Dysidea avara TaxID=196820 RepID=UPI003319BB94